MNPIVTIKKGVTHIINDPQVNIININESISKSVTITSADWNAETKLATVSADWAVAGMSATVSPDEDYTSVYKSANVQGVYLIQILNGYLIFRSGTGKILSDTIVMNIIAYNDSRGVIVNSGFVSVETNGISISSDANYTGTLSGNELTVTAITPVFKWVVPAVDGNGRMITAIKGSDACPKPLSELYLVNNVKRIEDDAFYGSTLKKLFIGKQVTSIGQLRVFRNTTNLKEIIFERGRTELLTIYTRESYTCIGDCIIEKLVIPDLVKIVGHSFGNCTYLKELRYESTYIMDNYSYFSLPFSQSPLDDCTFTAITPISKFGGVFATYATSEPYTSGKYIFVPYDSLTAYTTATNWVTYAHYMNGIGKFTAGTTLPTQTTDENWSLTWYATKADLKAGTNPITTAPSEFDNEYGEIYCTKTAVS